MAVSTENTVFIKAPLELVWEVTNDVANWPSLYSEYAAAEILEQDTQRVIFRLTTVPDEEDRTWTWVSERRPDPATHTVQAKRIDPGPFEHMDIFWSYRERDGGTEMLWRQEFHLRDDAPLDDETMRARINANTLVQMGLIKQRLEEWGLDDETMEEQDD
ncbi:MAG: putative polyketide cyclase [Amycolatopsis sp.]|uniref:SRPBCC family protein n=1 Tax=Amycolatopsis sp. TaxID=37632 RepID=UPI00260F2F8A|nr:SRPBCC family protein [Amycolatopsis sp.]MCU1686720.1 putative polyketide cyclase [Amycolatopsis sp.]